VYRRANWSELGAWKLSLNGRVGVFGGTFNPIHVGHLQVAEEAIGQFGLAQVLFVPTGTPPHKSVADGVSGELRYEMVRRAVEGRPGFAVSRVELNGPAYTVDTLAIMNEEYAQGIAYIVGADIFLKVEQWKDSDRLINSCPFIIAPREGISEEDFSGTPFAQAELYFLRMREIKVSSREIRERYCKGESVQGYVPPPVDEFIRKRGLYGVVQGGRVG